MPRSIRQALKIGDVFSVFGYIGGHAPFRDPIENSDAIGGAISLICMAWNLEQERETKVGSALFHVVDCVRFDSNDPSLLSLPTSFSFVYICFPRSRQRLSHTSILKVY